MIYFILFILLILFSIIEIFSNNKKKIPFIFLFVILSSLTVFRYGVGTDYFNYEILYNSYGRLGIENLSEAHGELGFKLLAKLFSFYNLDFAYFMFFISLVTCLLFFTGIYKNSKYYCFSLLIVYSLLWFTYINSGIRQGLAMGLFLCSIPLLLKNTFKSTLMYIFVILFSVLFHSSSIILLVIPVAVHIKKKYLYVIMFASLFIPILSILGLDISNKILSFFGNFGYLSHSIGLSAVLFRIIVILIIMTMYHLCKKDRNVEIYYKISIIGFIVYCFLSSNDLLASRIHAYFKVIEILSIPLFIYKIEELRKKILLFFLYGILICSIFYYKEVKGQIEQGGYYNSSVIHYKYFSIFDDKNNIYNFRYLKR